MILLPKTDLDDSNNTNIYNAAMNAMLFYVTYKACHLHISCFDEFIAVKPKQSH